MSAAVIAISAPLPRSGLSPPLSEVQPPAVATTAATPTTTVPISIRNVICLRASPQACHGGAPARVVADHGSAIVTGGHAARVATVHVIAACPRRALRTLMHFDATVSSRVKVAL